MNPLESLIAKLEVARFHDERALRMVKELQSRDWSRYSVADLLTAIDASWRSQIYQLEMDIESTDYVTGLLLDVIAPKGGGQ